MARQIDVSRTTVRGALQHLAESGVLARPGGGLTIARKPRKSDYFTETQTSDLRDLIERAFMQRMLLGDWQPGQRLLGEPTLLATAAPAQRRCESF